METNFKFRPERDPNISIRCLHLFRSNGHSFGYITYDAVRNVVNFSRRAKKDGRFTSRTAYGVVQIHFLKESNLFKIIFKCTWNDEIAPITLILSEENIRHLGKKMSKLIQKDWKLEKGKYIKLIEI